MMATTPIIRWLETQDYYTTWKAMQTFVAERQADTPDEIWLLEHTPVYTQGQNGKPEHVLHSGDIPIIQTDRGGQVTYHGPGQLMIYVLIDMKRLGLTIRQLVTRLEQSIIDFLAAHQLDAYAKCEAPGVYINQQKIASIGLRIRRGYTYHGIAFNVNMDLEPFLRINPCGFAGLSMTQLADLIDKPCSTLDTGQHIIPFLLQNLSPNQR